VALTVRDLVASVDVRVVAGEAGLDAPVRWVHISELPDPTPWLSGGELLLTTGMKVGDDGAAYVARLAEHGLAGLGIGVDTGDGLETVPPAMAEEADRRGFPLFVVPRDVPFIAVTEKAFTQIVNESYALLQRGIAAQERLEKIVLSERGLEGIAQALAKLVGGGAQVFDGRGELLATHGLDPDAIAGTLRGRIDRGAHGAFSPLGGRGLVLPVGRTGPGESGASTPPQAWLVAARADEPLSELDRLIVHQAVTTVALELLRRRVAAETERRLAGDVLASLLSGQLDGGELRRRLQPFGLGERVGAIVMAPEPPDRGAVEEAVLERLRAETGAGLVAAAGSLTCALVPAPADEAALFDLAERLRASASTAAGATLAAGAGRAVAAGEARRTFHEARCALEGRALAPGGGNGSAGRMLSTYRDLGSFQLLLSLQDDDALRLFCDSILGPIEEGEGAYGGELMRSLEVFIECNGQWEKAARQLYCHRHTLRYRVRRVEELTGRSLDSARDRIDFWLALRGRELLS
jgi:purine catabolism regulator